MFSRKLAQRTNAWLIRVDFFYTHSWVNGLCFGYFQIFPERSPFDLKITLTLTPFPYVRRLLDLRVVYNVMVIIIMHKGCMETLRYLLLLWLSNTSMSTTVRIYKLSYHHDYEKTTCSLHQ